MLMTFTEGDEYVAVCPACENEVYIWPDEDHAVPLRAYEDDPVFHTGQEAVVIQPASSLADEAAQALAERAGRIGEQKLTAHLPYLAGKTVCPACRENLSVWPALLGTFTI
jgi:Zn ribbon nucleic-acid-binding protein